MYIDPFICGVVATILIEPSTLIAIAIFGNRKK